MERVEANDHVGGPGGGHVADPGRAVSRHELQPGGAFGAEGVEELPDGHLVRPLAAHTTLPVAWSQTTVK